MLPQWLYLVTIIRVVEALIIWLKICILLPYVRLILKLFWILNSWISLLIIILAWFIRSFWLLNLTSLLIFRCIILSLIIWLDFCLLLGIFHLLLPYLLFLISLHLKLSMIFLLPRTHQLRCGWLHRPGASGATCRLISLLSDPISGHSACLSECSIIGHITASNTTIHLIEIVIGHIVISRPAILLLLVILGSISISISLITTLGIWSSLATTHCSDGVRRKFIAWLILSQDGRFSLIHCGVANSSCCILRFIHWSLILFGTIVWH